MFVKVVFLAEKPGRERFFAILSDHSLSFAADHPRAGGIAGGEAHHRVGDHGDDEKRQRHE